MSEYLKTYQMKLITVGPVFVGSGKKLEKKEYIFLDREHIGVMDIRRFYDFVRKNSMSKDFEDFMLKDGRKDLKHWALDHKINMDKMKACMKYVLDSGDTAIERGTQLQILECMKDSYGKPYIPGSSIKGMFRTILLGADMQNNSEKYTREKKNLEENLAIKIRRTVYLKRESESLEKRFYCTLMRNEEKPMDTVNDSMAGFIVSDSEPLSMKDIVLCQKIEKHVDGQEKRLNVLRECIRPGTEIKFTITIDETLSDLTIEKIKDAVQIFAENYYEMFKSAFADVDRPQKNELYLGGGCGFSTKTVLSALYEKEKNVKVTKTVFENTGVPREHKHQKDLEYGVSPHILKCTRYQGKLEEMGLCRLEC